MKDNLEFSKIQIPKQATLVKDKAVSVEGKEADKVMDLSAIN